VTNWCDVEVVFADVGDKAESEGRLPGWKFVCGLLWNKCGGGVKAKERDGDGTEDVESRGFGKEWVLES